MTYIDSRGVTMDKMSYSEALTIVLDLAQQDFEDIDVDHPSYDIISLAVESITKLKENMSNEIDNLELPLHYEERQPILLDSSDIIHNMKIIIDIANQNKISEQYIGNETSLAETLDIQNQAIDITYHLASRFPEKIDNINELMLSRTPTFKM